MATQIHPTAIVEDGAELGVDVQIGPYSIVGSNVKIGDGCVLHSHVVVKGLTTLGPRNEIFPFASIGHRSQDKKYNGEDTTLQIGADNTIREYATLQPGTVQDLGTTIVGDRNLFMVGTHVAHDCVVGNDCVLANNATLAGHVTLEDNVILGGLCPVHQHVQIGRMSIIGGNTAVIRDLLPFSSSVGNRAEVVGLNLVGLRRKEFDRQLLKDLKVVYKEILLGVDGNVEERAQRMAQQFDWPEVQEIYEFVKKSSRGLASMRVEEDA
jgi:UDP-N-acetylglucosamine acyltransferase